MAVGPNLPLTGSRALCARPGSGDGWWLVVTVGHTPIARILLTRKMLLRLESGAIFDEDGFRLVGSPFAVTFALDRRLLGRVSHADLDALIAQADLPQPALLAGLQDCGAGANTG